MSISKTARARGAGLRTALGAVGLVAVLSLGGCPESDGTSEICLLGDCVQGADCDDSGDCGPTEVCADNGGAGVCVEASWCTAHSCAEFGQPGTCGSETCESDELCIGDPPNYPATCSPSCIDDSTCDSLCCVSLGGWDRACAPVGSPYVDYCSDDCNYRVPAVSAIAGGACGTGGSLIEGVVSNTVADAIYCLFCQSDGVSHSGCVTDTLAGSETVSLQDLHPWCTDEGQGVDYWCTLATDDTALCIDNVYP
ncbi:MAG: hypothetical protein ABI333_12290 [bacterium]